MADTPDVLIARAAVHYRAGAFDVAAQCGLDIVAQVPDHFDALHLLGVLCMNRGQTADAACYLARAARLQPDNPQLNLNFGNVWLALKLFSRAEAASRRIVGLYPNNADALCNLAAALLEQHREPEALEVVRTALVHKPDHVPALFFMAKALQASDRLEEAAAAFQAALASATALDTAPERITDILTNLGGVLVALDRPEAALALFVEEQARRSERLDLTWNRSLLHLQLGNFVAGWRDYESRWLVKDHDKPRADATVPDLDGIQGKTILLTVEQGRGDVIQFVRYVPLLTAHGATVCLSVYDDLKRLLTGMPGVAGVYGEDEHEPIYDIVTPLMSLPLIFKTEIETIPSSVPYIRATPDRIASWKEHSVITSRKNVGLAWSSTNPGAARSMALAVLRPLLDCPEVAFHSLQKELNVKDLEFLREDGRILDHRVALTDFAETAALIEALDLVVAIDTGVAHLAGALGKPVWIMLPHAAEWRWLQHREDSPWYPTARLFRQASRGDWDGVVARVVEALNQRR